MHWFGGGEGEGGREASFLLTVDLGTSRSKRLPKVAPEMNYLPQGVRGGRGGRGTPALGVSRVRRAVRDSRRVLDFASLHPV